MKKEFPIFLACILLVFFSHTLFAEETTQHSSANTDAGITSITNPNGNVCGSNFIPIVTLKNFGNDTLITCTLIYHTDTSANQSYNWSGTLATGDSVIISFPLISATAGTHTFFCSTVNPNGAADTNTSNDSSQSNFNINNITASLPVSVGFEGDTHLPAGWSVDNPDMDAGWEVYTEFARTGTNSIAFNNCNGNGDGVDMTNTKDRFITCNYDFTNATVSAALTFDIAYALLDYKGHVYPDSLAIFSSSDCGNTWTQIYLNGGIGLTGITTTLSCRNSSSTDWRTKTINLGSLAGKPNVQFAFENHSGWGEWLYLDNITITALTNITEINSGEGFKIYPNPASTFFTISGVSSAKQINYSVFNMLGAAITFGTIKTNGQFFEGKIRINNARAGIYYVRIDNGKNTWTEKLDVQR